MARAPPQQPDLLRLFHLFVRIEIRARHVPPVLLVVRDDLEPVLARLVEVGVARDLVHPRRKIRSRLKRLPVFQHAKKHFLHQVLTQPAIGGEPQEEVEEHAVMAVEQNADAFHVAVANREHDQVICLGFHLNPLPHRASMWKTALPAKGYRKVRHNVGSGRRRSLKIELSPEDSGKRLDHVLHQRLPQFSRARLQDWIKDGRVLINGAVRRTSYLVRTGDVADVQPAEPAPLRATAEEIPLTVLYEDEDLVAIDKPAGMVVHSGAGVHSGTLVNALLHRFGSLSRAAGRAAARHRAPPGPLYQRRAAGSEK